MNTALQENVSLAPYNSFGIAVKARYFAEIKAADEISAVLHDPVVDGLPLLILGGGSNMLFTKDFDGLVLKISIEGIDAVEHDDVIHVTAGAGVVWHDFVQYCVQHNYAGVENLSLIPGTVGASPVQNIGAYGVELKDVLFSCNVYNLESGTISEFSAADCRFGYRDSIFKQELKNKVIITSVTFRLHREAKLNTAYGAINEELHRRGISSPTIGDISAVVSHIRVSKLPDPSTIGNAGSFFKNPVIGETDFKKVIQDHPDVVHYPAGAGRVKLAAGWLIEQCGLKGLVWGNTGTWKNQALVLVNHGGATGREVYDFSDHIIQTVKNKFGIELEREVNIL